MTTAMAQIWDVVVVGAGPAGAAAAAEAARRGASVLLVDKAAFPRYKVCGCCLNGSALTTLEQIGLGRLPTRLGATSLRMLRLVVDGRRASIPISRMAVSREAFDTALVRHAVASGAHFLPETLAALDSMGRSGRRLTLHDGIKRISVEARVVLAADGLAGRLLRQERLFASSVAHNARIGVGTMCPASPSDDDAGAIVMACGRGGYAGLVRVEDGRLAIAAALDPGYVRDTGGPGAAVARILAQAGCAPIPGLNAMSWRGTPALTHRRTTLAADRLFILGDAAGYAEPFTGEGIAWALASGVAVVPLALTALRHWTPSLAAQWTHRYRRLVDRRHARCHVITRLLRHPTLTRVAVRVLSHAPRLAMPLE